MKLFDYTRTLRRFATKFPMWNYVMVQIIFWIISYVFLGVLAHLVILTFEPEQGPFLHLYNNLIIAVFLGFFTGLVSGYVDQLLEKKFFLNKALGIIIVIKTIISLIVLIILLSFLRYRIYPFFARNLLDPITTSPSGKNWEYFFILLLIYTAITGLLIGFINQVNKKFGPAVLLPLLLGRYRSPREEKKIFLFMDLKSSTSIAEELGHLKYSAFIRDSYMDINTVLRTYHAQIYQYVGDQIVITWTIAEGLESLSCIRFFFACEKKFKDKAAYYNKLFGKVPEFKAGLHMGKVTVVEVGNIKRDIAYHGDTMNTTARIQSLCNEYNKSFLASSLIVEASNAGKYYNTESLGMIDLKGKSELVEILSIEQVKPGKWKF